MKLFFRGCSFESKEEISFEQLLHFVNEKKPIWINPYPVNAQILFLNFIKALVYGFPFTFLDQSFSLEEVALLQKGDYTPDYRTGDTLKSIDNLEELIKQIRASTSEITLFTSGTTGQPTLVTHTVPTLSREVRFTQGQDIIWGLAYNPTHMAGIQVFFQALLNLNPLIDLFNLLPKEVEQRINENTISHISATPTFFRLLLTSGQNFASVKRIALGGEKSTPELIANIKASFPNAKVNNIYASTEAGALFASQGDGFIIPKEKSQFIKIVKGEIFIHKNFLSKSVKTIDDWYATGDLIDWIDEKLQIFKIIGRKNEMLNVGGMKVNPSEVEDEILGYPNISQAIVYGKPNSVVGTLICADIVLIPDTDFQEAEIKKFLRTKLQSHKVPRKFYVVTAIELSRTGKTKRNRS